MNDVGTIWQEGWKIRIPKHKPEGGDALRGYDRLIAQAEELKHALTIIQEHEPGLVTGTPKISLSRERVSFILDELYKDCEGYTLKRRHNFFCKGIRAGREKLEWDVPTPSPMIMLPREKSPFTPERFANLRLFNHVFRKFMLSLEDPTFYHQQSCYTEQAARVLKSSEVSASDINLGRLLFSALANGALLNIHWLNALLTAIARNDIVIEEDLLWVELQHSIPYGQRKADFHRRWFPDPITSLLLVKWLSGSGSVEAEEFYSRSGHETVYFYVKRYFASVSIEPITITAFNQCLDAAATRVGFRLPQLFVQYAGSISDAPSLPATSWARLIYDQVPVSNDEAPEDDNFALNDKNPGGRLLPQADSAARYPDQLAKLRELQSLFSRYHHKKIPTRGMVCKSLGNFLFNRHTICPMLEALSEWCLMMMRTKRLSSKKTSPSSMRSYLYAIGKDLILYGANFALTALSVKDWENLYDQILEQANSPQRRSYKGKRLKEFHTFLQFSMGVPEVNIEDIAGGLRVVNANVITPREYHDIKKAIANNQIQPERLRKIQALLFTLGFRCGLRRKEALNIELDDLQLVGRTVKGTRSYATRPELLVRGNMFGRVKSYKSTRRLPLSILLTEEEIFELLRWKEERLSELEKSSCTTHRLLFCLKGKDRIPLSDDQTFKPIQEVMKELSGDSSLRYHNLRHSFATFLLLRIFAEELPDALPEMWMKLNGVDLFPKLPTSSIRQRLLLIPEVAVTRRLLYVESLLCGHVDPKETIATYSHLFDWVVGVILRQDQEPLSSNMQAGIMGLTPGSLKIFRNRLGLKGETTALELVKILGRRIANKFENPIKGNLIPRATILKKSLPPKGNSRPSIFFLHQVVASAIQTDSMATVAAQFDIPASDIQSWVEQAKYLASLRTPRGVPRLTSRHIKGGSGRYCPPLPNSVADKKDAADIYDGVLALMESDEALARAGVALYLTRSTQTQTDIKFKSPEEKGTWVLFLKAIGIASSRIMVSLVLNAKQTEEEQKGYWLEKFQLPEENCWIQPSRVNRPTRLRYGNAGVWITGPEVTPIKQRGASPRTWPALGLHVGIYMAAIFLKVNST